MANKKVKSPDKFPGTGAILRPPQPGDVRLFGIAHAELPPVDWSKDTQNPLPPGENQNGSGSCTSQAAGYAIFQKLGIEIVREDPYSHTFLPGGGAYLVSPFEFMDQNGILPRSDKYQDPKDETEQAMETILQVEDGDRVRTFSIKPKLIMAFDIDSAARIIDQYGFVILGINGKWSKGWEKGSEDPYFDSASFDPNRDWRHALFGANHKMIGSRKVIECVSSWRKTTPPAVHHIDENYFANGGVFEILAIDIKEITMEKNYSVLLPDGSEAVITISPEGLISGVVARNEQEFADLGARLKISTCKPDPKKPGKWIFTPPDLAPKKK